LHASIKEVTVVPKNQDCMEEEADVPEMPVYLTDFDPDKESEKEMEACATVGVNHDWEEFATRDWVREGQLLFQKQCIGTRNGGICGRMFVNHAFSGTNEFYRYRVLSNCRLSGVGLQKMSESYV
jgi:hypothetical protein